MVYRRLFVGFLLSLFLSFSGSAHAELNQVAYADDVVMLYEQPSAKSKSTEVTLPDGGVSVPSAVRKGGDLWYKVTVDGHTGWIKSEGVYLKMGPKSKMAENIYKHYRKTLDKFFEGKGPDDSWTMRESVSLDAGNVITWASMGAVIQSMGSDRGVLDMYFASNNKRDCKKFLGFEAIGMSEKELRGKMGTPTARGSDVFYYERLDSKASFSFTLKNDKVALVEFSAKPADGGAWPEDVLSIRGFRKWSYF